jgi:hypothetical protein
MNCKGCFGRVSHLLLLMASIGAPACATETFTTYFRNDSVSGLKISDAYETHNMGVLWKKDDIFFEFDLGIVSPDMHIYKNQYRVANRSFGEIVSITYGENQSLRDNVEIDYYFKLSSSGTFGIDRVQDLAHKVLGLQPVNQVNDLVRMPNTSWVGFGGAYRSRPKSIDTLSQTLGFQFYLGTDKFELTPFVSGKIEYDKYTLLGEIGLNLVQFDEIVSASPISAEHRNFIPYIELGVDFDYLGLKWFIKDRLSLPTIADDDSIFAVLSAGIEFNLD